MTEDFGVLEPRPERYDILFAGELPYAPLPEDAELGLSGLCRITRRSGGKRPAELKTQLYKLPDMVFVILASHQEESHELDEPQAVFGFTDPDSQTLVTDIVTDVFTQWEITRNRRKLDPILPGVKHPAKWLVVETAAAVMSAGTPENGFDLRRNQRDRDIITKMIFNWGPKFISQWFDGTIISQWSDEKGFSPEEKASWNEVFTPALRKHFASQNVLDPLDALDRTRFHLVETLNDDNLARRLGWEVEDVQALITPSVRKQAAIGMPKDPLAACERIKRNLETTLSVEGISSHFGWTAEEVEDTFEPSLRKHLAVHNAANPLAALNRIKRHLQVTLTNANIAQRTGWTEEKVGEAFTPTMRKRLAIAHIDDPLSAAEKVADHLTQTLTDERLAESLGLSEADVRLIFVQNVRKRLATRYISDPLKAAEEWLRGKKIQSSNSEIARDNKLADLGISVTPYTD